MSGATRDPEVQQELKALEHACNWLTRMTYARHRIRHGTRHTAARTGDILCPCLGFACESGAHRHEPHQRKSRMVETS